MSFGKNRHICLKKIKHFDCICTNMWNNKNSNYDILGQWLTPTYAISTNRSHSPFISFENWLDHAQRHTYKSDQCEIRNMLKMSIQLLLFFLVASFALNTPDKNDHFERKKTDQGTEDKSSDVPESSRSKDEIIMAVIEEDWIVREFFKILEALDIIVKELEESANLKFNNTRLKS